MDWKQLRHYVIMFTIPLQASLLFVRMLSAFNHRQVVVVDAAGMRAETEAEHDAIDNRFLFIYHQLSESKAF